MDGPWTPEGLRTLLEALADRLGLSVDGGAMQQALQAAAGTSADRSAVEEASAVLGIRLRWLHGLPAEMFSLARPELPVVGRGVDGSLWIIDGHRPGWTRARPVGDGRSGRWFRTRNLLHRFDSTPMEWALAEPAMPASSLSSPPGETLSPWARLRALLSLEKDDVTVVIILGIVAGGLSLATPLAIQAIINWLAFGALLQPVVILGLALAVCLALAAFLQIQQRLAVETIERRILVRMVGDLSVRMSRTRLAAFDGHSRVELANRFFDVLTLQKAAGTLLLDGLTASLQVMVAVTLLAMYHPILLIYDVVLVAGMSAVLFWFGRGASDTAVYESKAKYALADWMEQIAEHTDVLRQAGSPLATRQAEELTRTWLLKREAHFGVFYRQLVSSQVLQVLLSVLLLITCGSLVLDGELTLGQLVAAEFIVTTALIGFVKFVDKLDTAYDLLAGVDKLGQLLDLPPETPYGIDPGLQTPASLHVDGVQPSPPDPARLDAVLPAGSRALIRGVADVGHSTLADILVGQRPAPAGEVLRDGLPAQILRPAVRHGDSLLLRPGGLMHRSVRHNLTLAVPDITDNTVMNALEMVGLGPWIRHTPDGLDTLLAPQGADVVPSRDRALLVARALVLQPRLLVVDGLLDGMSPDAQQRLLPLLLSPEQAWTLIMLSQDPNLHDDKLTALSLTTEVARGA